MIMGMESIDKGTFEVGETVKVGYADQTHKDIDPNKTVYQVVSGGQDFIRVGRKRNQLACLPVTFQLCRSRPKKNFAASCQVENVTACTLPSH